MRKLLLILTMASAPAFSQEGDVDYLTSFLQDSLSDAGRKVTITGFTGALSSQATIERLSIADKDGVWLTLEEVTLDWSQSALLSGELVVNELSAERLSVSRLPDKSQTSVPSPEASGFRLPELPVSIGIDNLRIEAIELDASVLGQPVEGHLEAAFTLAEGTGLARLDLARSGEGPAGSFTLFARFDNTTRQLDMALAAGEDAGGIVAEALGLPGAPATNLQLSGSGPLDAFSADILLSTDQQKRLVGTVSISGKPDNALRLQAELAGNLAPLFLPEYADFLGTDLNLIFDAERSASGDLSVDNFSITARSFAIYGLAKISADGVPESLSFSAQVEDPNGGHVLLPLGGTPTKIDRASFVLDTQRRDDGVDWSIEALIDGFDRTDLAITTLKFAGTGEFTRSILGKRLSGALTYLADNLAPSDKAVAASLGKSLSGKLAFTLAENDGILRLTDISLIGLGLQGTGELQIKGLSSAFPVSGKLGLDVDDLSRFADLAGWPLTGAGKLSLEGEASLISGAIDGTATLATTDLTLGVEPLDRLFSGTAIARLSLIRDGTGTILRDLAIDAGDMTALLSGTIRSTGSELSGKITLQDMAALDSAYSGIASLDLFIVGAGDAWQMSLAGNSEDLAFGNTSADRLLKGKSSITAELDFAQDAVAVQSIRLKNNQLEVSVSASTGEDRREYSVQGTLADLGQIIPELKGKLNLGGTIVDDGAALLMDLTGTGPGKVDAKIAGSVSRDFASAALDISGTGQAGLANPFIAPRLLAGPGQFDLRLEGPVSLSSLSGKVIISEGRLSDPDLGFSVRDIEAIANLSSGRAEISATARLSSGGKLSLDGPVDLSNPHAADLAVTLDQVRFFDPQLYETTLNGNLKIKGALTGGATISGALSLTETEIIVSESGIDAAGLLAGLIHRNEPVDVHATRVRAGLLENNRRESSASGAAYRLDLALSAPSRIFLRGRGIDAELGGALQLTGTTQSVAPAGEFSLIRGRLDILGKRLVLETANLMLEGSFTPHLEITASTESEGIQSTVKIEGRADDPIVAFSSIPDLPQEEVLARLLFGHGLDGISALQAAQLAQAVAVLAGRGGEGVISRLRKGFGLDDLDLATADDGTAAVKAGKYITDNLYTEVEIDQSGTSNINLNLDLGPSLTAKGRVGDDGATGIGIFLEKDY